MTDQVSKPTKEAGEWSRGWPIVLASLVGIALCLSPLPYWALIVIGEELAKEFGWSREIVTAGFLFMTSGVLIGAPVAGQLVDRYGARRVLLPSILALGIGTASFSLMTANPAVFYTIFFFTAFFGSATLPITWSKAIVNNFDKHRGLALGIALTGTGLYGFIATPSIQAVIDAFGWRMAYVSVGLLPILLSFPLALMIFRDKKEEQALLEVDHSHSKSFASWVWQPVVIGLLLFLTIITALSKLGPLWVVLLMAGFLGLYLIYVWMRDGKTKDTALPGLTLRETFKDYRFWVIFFAFLILGGVVSGIIANSKWILLDKGYTATAATGYFTGAGLIGLATMGGRLVGGWLVDHFWAPLIAFIFMSVPAIGCYILMQDYGMGVNAIALILVGFAAGVEFDMMAYFVSRYFGTKAYGRIYGLIYAAFGLGSGTSPIIFNLIRGDDTDYARVLSFVAFGFIIGATILLSLGKYRDFGDPHASGH